MKKIFTSAFMLVSLFSHAQVIATGFDGYTGPGSEPTGWNISNISTYTYTTTGNFGAASPSVKLSASGHTITTPTLSHPTSVQFWAKGQSMSGTSALLVEQMVSGTYATVISLSVTAGTLTNSAATYGPYTLSNLATSVRFTYTKVGGNLAMDDITVAQGLLPLTLYSFTGSNTNKTSLLKWTVGNETNISGYEVERSTDGINFNEIGFVKATGNNDYLYTDATAKTSLNFYRLKIIGINEIKYSEVVKILSGLAEVKINVYPLPATNTVNATFMSEKNETTSLQITDVNDRIILQKNTQLTKGYNNINFDVNTLSKGLYILKLVLAGKVSSTVFTKL